MLTCQKVECEEEILQRILSTMFLTEIDCNIAYTEFIKCINKDGTLHYFKYQNYLHVIIGNNIYKAAQKEFFENLFRNSSKAVRVIGTIIIFLSKGNKGTKIDLLKTHFNKYYQGLNDNTIKEFVQDIINANTDNCIVSFKNNLSIELIRNMCDIYQKKRKRKLENYILDSYDDIKSKYYNTKKTNEISLENKELTSSLLIDNDSLFKSEEQTIAEEKVLKEFFELSFSQLNGEFIRNWLYDEYIKDKPYDNTCFDISI